MSEPQPYPGRKNPLPPGWFYADWEGEGAAEAWWDESEVLTKAKLRVRFMEITAAQREGKRLPHQKHFVDRGIGKAKVKKPSPGVRVWEFREGDHHYISHITPKVDCQHNKEIEQGLVAKAEHLRRKARRAKR